MARSANIGDGSFYKLFLLGGMGVVTIQTSDIIHQGPVHPIFGKRFVHHVFVALPAQLIALLLGLERGFRFGPRVALSTFFLADRLMSIGIQDTLFVGAVRVVAGAAVGIRYGVVHVLLFKKRFVGLMAPQAKRGRFLFQQKSQPVRGMGVVAVETPLVF